MCAYFSNLIKNPITFVKIGEVCTITKGIQFNKSDMSDIGTYPVINGGILPSGYIELYNQSANTITISQGGASAGYVNWQCTPFWAGAHCYVISPNPGYSNRFLYHLLKNYEKLLQKCQFGAGIPALSKKDIENLTVPSIPIELQEELARILDNFTELTAELTARKKQYEYYRDKLLSFNRE